MLLRRTYEQMAQAQHRDMIRAARPSSVACIDTLFALQHAGMQTCVWFKGQRCAVDIDIYSKARLDAGQELAAC